MLSARQQAVLRSAMDRIVPADDFPSASQAGVETYFERQFNGDLRGQAAAYAACLDALDAEARATGATGFVELDATAQDELLKRIERGKARAVWPEEPARFFERLVHHVMEGYYADPGNGGNRGAVSWSMVGYGGRKT